MPNMFIKEQSLGMQSSQPLQISGGLGGIHQVQFNDTITPLGQAIGGLAKQLIDNRHEINAHQLDIDLQEMDNQFNMDLKAHPEIFNTEEGREILRQKYNEHNELKKQKILESRKDIGNARYINLNDSFKKQMDTENLHLQTQFNQAFVNEQIMNIEVNNNVTNDALYLAGSNDIYDVDEYYRLIGKKAKSFELTKYVYNDTPERALNDLKSSEQNYIAGLKQQIYDPSNFVDANGVMDYELQKGSIENAIGYLTTGDRFESDVKQVTKAYNGKLTEDQVRVELKRIREIELGKLLNKTKFRKSEQDQANVFSHKLDEEKYRNTLSDYITASKTNGIKINDIPSEVANQSMNVYENKLDGSYLFKASDEDLKAYGIIFDDKIMSHDQSVQAVNGMINLGEGQYTRMTGKDVPLLDKKDDKEYINWLKNGVNSSLFGLNKNISRKEMTSLTNDIIEYQTNPHANTENNKQAIASRIKNLRDRAMIYAEKENIMHDPNTKTFIDQTWKRDELAVVARNLGIPVEQITQETIAYVVAGARVYGLSGVPSQFVDKLKDQNQVMMVLKTNNPKAMEPVRNSFAPINKIINQAKQDELNKRAGLTTSIINQSVNDIMNLSYNASQGSNFTSTAKFEKAGRTAVPFANNAHELKVEKNAGVPTQGKNIVNMYNQKKKVVDFDPTQPLKLYNR